MARLPYVASTKASLCTPDLDLLFQLLHGFQPGVCLEIGSWRGHSGLLWETHFKPVKFISVEKDRDAYLEVPEERRHGRRSYYILGDSHELSTQRAVTAQCQGYAVDFLFIDGDHSYEGVKKDWEIYRKLLSQTSVVVFHDVCYTSNDEHAPVQVSMLWDEIKQHPDRDCESYVEIKSCYESTGMGVLFYGKGW